LIRKIIDQQTNSRVLTPPPSSEAKMTEPKKIEFVRLPLEQIARSGSFDIGTLWEIGCQISILAKTDFLKKMQKDQLHAWAAYLKTTVDGLLEQKEISLWMVEAPMIGIDHGNPDSLMNYLDLEEIPGAKELIIKINKTYSEQLKQFLSQRASETEPQLSYTTTFVIPNVNQDHTETKRLKAGEGLIVAMTEANAKQWLRENIVGIDHRNMYLSSLSFLTDMSAMKPI
jgi:hypothetical protein